MTNHLISEVFSVISIIALVGIGSGGSVFLILKGVNAYFDLREEKRRAWLKKYVFPESCCAEVQPRYIHLTCEQIDLAFEQLRLYFEVCLLYSSPGSSKFVAMPSKLVDSCWHSFICETREYQAFCTTAFGGFLHHASRLNTTFTLVDISTEEVKNMGIAKSKTDAQVQREINFKNQLSAARIYQWTYATCREHNNSEAAQVPQLFSIDEQFKIKDGYFYPLELLNFLAEFDLKTAEAIVTKQETESASSSAAACGDGGSCGGCGGSI
jgi:hypothetical protein